MTPLDEKSPRLARAEAAEDNKQQAPGHPSTATHWSVHQRQTTRARRLRLLHELEAALYAGADRRQLRGLVATIACSVIYTHPRLHHKLCSELRELRGFHDNVIDAEHQARLRRLLGRLRRELLGAPS